MPTDEIVATEQVTPTPETTSVPAPESATPATIEDYFKASLEGAVGQATAPEVTTEQPKPEIQPETELVQANEPEPGKTVPYEVFQKRVDQLTFQKSELARRAEKAEAELRDAQSKITPKQTPAPQGSSLVEYRSEQDLDAYENTARQALETVEKFQQNAMRSSELESFKTQLKAAGAYDPDTDQVDASRLYDIKRELERDVSQRIPARREHLRRQSQFDAVAAERLPYLKDPEHEDTLLFNKLAQSLPGIDRYPQWKLAVGAMVKGIKADLKETAKPKQTVTPAPRVPGASAIVAPAAPDRAQTNGQLRDRAIQSRDPKAVEAWIKSQLQ